MARSKTLDMNGSKPTTNGASEHGAPETRYERNTGIPLDLGWVNRQRVNLSATERRAKTIPARRSVKQDAQAAWLLKAVSTLR